MKEALNYPKLITLVFLALGGLLFSRESHAQRINFSTWTGSDDITITPVLGSPNLNFNQKQANISVNSPAVTINLLDNQAVAFRIEAPEGFDLTVEVDAPAFLSLDGAGTVPQEQIPFRVGIAYNNMEAGNEMTAKAGAVQLPTGFYNVTFPVNRRVGGAPGPPPTPISGTDTLPKATAYLFIYGELGPIGPVNAGNYLGEININVFFTSND
ncbi:hypothetical protein D0X99_11935 [Algoriphagus lacus]|uniref:DUF4402 domain-containing protein n=1 Tax=Algoriphagus lacus TaxID=2056311 RepID=A0A418PRG5_9BACT|nr:hypothetical protein [Algoriphagus lacus]RIW15148.1 hypothetical protein D0X99_11935 [Algoriphagus lacus]